MNSVSSFEMGRRYSKMNVNNCSSRCDYVQFYYISAGSSTCFWWYPRTSSGAHSNCNYNIWHWSNRICYRLLTWRSRTVANTVRAVPDVVITVWVCSCWWMRVSSETCRAVCRKCNKTVYSRILLDSYWHWITLRGPMNVKNQGWLGVVNWYVLGF